MPVHDHEIVEVCEENISKIAKAFGVSEDAVRTVHKEDLANNKIRYVCIAPIPIDPYAH